MAVSPEEAVGYSDQVFTGTLVQRTEHSHTRDNGVSLVFAVSRVYKGNVGEFTEVFTHAQSSACGVRVPADTEVVILSQLWQGKLSVGLCLDLSISEVESVLGPSGDPDTSIAAPTAYQTSNRRIQSYVFAGILTGLAAIAIVWAMMRLTDRQSRH